MILYYIYGQERINFLTNIKAIKKPQLINFHQTKKVELQILQY